MTAMILLALTILLQFIAVVQSLKLSRITSWRRPWLLFTIAFTLIFILSLSEFYLEFSDSDQANTKLLSELVALIFSMMLVFALFQIPSTLQTNRERERLINKNKLNLKQAQHIAHLGFWEWNIIDDHMAFSDEIFRLLGVRAKHFPRDLHAFVSRIHPDDRVAFKEAINAALYERTPFKFKHRIQLNGGHVRHVSQRAEVKFDPHGRPEFMFGTMQDISEQVHATEALSESNKRIQLHQNELAHATRMATLGEMASGLAHELNQPLSAIINYAKGGKRRLAEEILPAAESALLLQKIAEQAERAAQIIKRMRGFVRKAEVQPHALDLCELIAHVIDFMQATMTSKDLRIELKCDPELPQVLADTIQIEQVMTNLMRNASEAMEQANCRYCKISIEVSRLQTPFIRVAVTDTGPGLSKEDKYKLAEPFYTSKPNGLGLGLSICQTIIESHGGKLRLDGPQPETGATISFTLPITNGQAYE